VINAVPNTPRLDSPRSTAELNLAAAAQIVRNLRDSRSPAKLARHAFKEASRILAESRAEVSR
jgi:hypothetical protein